LSKVLTEKPARLRDLNPHLPEALDDICRTCLEKDPLQRYPSAAALKSALQSLQAGSPASSEPAEPAASSVSAPPVAMPAASVVFAPSVASSTLPKSRSRSTASKIAASFGLILALVAILAIAWYLFGAVGPIPIVDNISDEQERAALANWKNDFDLNVAFAGQRDIDKDVYRFVEGDLLKIRVESKADAYVGIWYVDKKGNAVQIFPNDFDNDNRLLANQPRIVPNEESLLEMGPTDGVWEVHVLASSRPWKAPDIGKKDGFVVFNTDFEKNVLKNTLRTIRVKAVPTGQPKLQVARAVLRYQVSAVPGMRPSPTK
jgi:hypothetical protein